MWGFGYHFVVLSRVWGFGFLRVLSLNFLKVFNFRIQDFGLKRGVSLKLEKSKNTKTIAPPNTRSYGQFQSQPKFMTKRYEMGCFCVTF